MQRSVAGARLSAGWVSPTGTRLVLEGCCRNPPAAPAHRLASAPAGHLFPKAAAFASWALVKPPGSAATDLVIYGLPVVPDKQASPGGRQFALNRTRYLGRGGSECE